jgi:hypothetical protein
MNGMCLADFKTHAEALKTADELIAINKAEYCHAGDKVEHEMPLLSCFFTSRARKKTHVLASGIERVVRRRRCQKHEANARREVVPRRVGLRRRQCVFQQQRENRKCAVRPDDANQRHVEVVSVEQYVSTTHLSGSFGAGVVFLVLGFSCHHLVLLSEVCGETVDRLPFDFADPSSQNHGQKSERARVRQV